MRVEPPHGTGAAWEKMCRRVIRAGRRGVSPGMTLQDTLASRDASLDCPGRTWADAGGSAGMTSEDGASDESSLAENHAGSEMTRALLAVRDRRDREAFGRLFDHYGPRLKAMLVRGGQRDGTAEDIVQDVMLAVWQKAAQFDPHRAEASAWIYRIARNRQIDLVRRRPRPAPDPLEEPPGLEPDAAQIVVIEQEAGRLRDALSRLSPEQGRAIEQAYMQDMAHSQISQVTGVPLGTIKSRIRLGLERLRRELKDLKP
jgi:RNA polymerase sigma-70 factor, ECF subfamily